MLFFAPKTCRKACIIWSVCGLTCAPSLHVITCRLGLGLGLGFGFGLGLGLGLG